MKNYREEMEFYENLSRLGEARSETEGNSRASPSQSASGTSNNPLEIS